jgi:hypothetical protein
MARTALVNSEFWEITQPNRIPLAPKSCEYVLVYRLDGQTWQGVTFDMP